MGGHENYKTSTNGNRSTRRTKNESSYKPSRNRLIQQVPSVPTSHNDSATNNEEKKVHSDCLEAKQWAVTGRMARLNHISRALNDHLDYIEGARYHHHTGYDELTTAASTAMSLSSGASFVSALSAQKQEMSKEGLLQESTHFKIPNHLLRINKDLAIFLNVRPNDRGFVFWFALSSYIPLVAACLGPLANMISIAALVDRWRMDSDGNYMGDPLWIIIVNSVSIAVGTLSDFSLIMNFSRNLNYLVAQVISIIGWFIASVLLVSIIVEEHIHNFRSTIDGEVYHPTEGFYFAILTAFIYFTNSVLLFCNLVGHLMNKYSDEFNLDSAQRVLIFYTLAFAVWLSVGAGAFTRLNSISYGTSLYFCVVSVTTVGLGDIVPKSDGAKAFVLIYALIGLLILGLIIATVRQMVLGNNEPIIFWSQVEKRRERIYNKYLVILENNYKKRQETESEKKNQNNDYNSDLFGGNTKKKHKGNRDAESKSVLAKLPNDKNFANTSLEAKLCTAGRDQRVEGGSMDVDGFNYGNYGLAANEGDENDGRVKNYEGLQPGKYETSEASLINGQRQRRKIKRPKLPIPRSKKFESISINDISDEDMFNLMELIRRKSRSYQRILSLIVTVFVFVGFWLIGAVAFKYMEGWSYFESAYFCFLCLLTIGYGAPFPKSAFAKAFFVVWALGAIPLNTILISNIGDTIFILCVDYSDRITNFVYAGNLSKFLPGNLFNANRVTINDLESALSEPSKAPPKTPLGPPEEIGENSNLHTGEVSHVFDELSAIGSQLQAVISKGIELNNGYKESEQNMKGDLSNDTFFSMGNHDGDHEFSPTAYTPTRALEKLLRNQRDILELMDILESIKELMNSQASLSGSDKIVSHPYKDWNHLLKLLRSTIRNTNTLFSEQSLGNAEDEKAEMISEKNKMFWISERSPLKYPLDENNYFLYRYIKIFDIKMKHILRDHIEHYNHYLQYFEQSLHENMLNDHIQDKLNALLPTNSDDSGTLKSETDP